MESHIRVQPLPYRTRRRTFLILTMLFIAVLPLLYFYATGYRFDFSRPTNLIGTGGMYIGMEDKDNAFIFIDDVSVDAERLFRRGFYVQGLDIGTHRIHVQKDGYHTWVKELPVSKHLVTEVEVFNLPLVPQVRVISRWQSATGTMIVHSSIQNASTTNEVIATTTTRTKDFIENPEFSILLNYFSTTTVGTSTPSKTTSLKLQPGTLEEGTTTTISAKENSTTTVRYQNVKLYEKGADVFAQWVGPLDEMPYYFCASEFPRYSSSTSTTTSDEVDSRHTAALGFYDDEEIQDSELIIHPVQTVSEDTVCEPVIPFDRKGQIVHSFNFFPGSSDFVILLLDDGIYMVEIDDRSWQNIQPLFIGDDLHMHIENGLIYVYDGELIYQIISTRT